jgi:hypothetical protein
MMEKKATCPKCNYYGEVDTSEHVYFTLGVLALRCKKCYYVWKDPDTTKRYNHSNKTRETGFLSTDEVRDREGK